MIFSAFTPQLQWHDVNGCSIIDFDHHLNPDLFRCWLRQFLFKIIAELITFFFSLIFSIAIAYLIGNSKSKHHFFYTPNAEQNQASYVETIMADAGDLSYIQQNFRKAKLFHSAELWTIYLSSKQVQKPKQDLNIK